MADKATLEIKIEDKGGPVDYNQPIRYNSGLENLPRMPNPDTTSINRVGLENLRQEIHEAINAKTMPESSGYGLQNLRDELIDAMNANKKQLATVPDDAARNWRLISSAMSGNPATTIDAIRQMQGQKNTEEDEKIKFFLNSAQRMGTEIQNLTGNIAALDVRGFGEEITDLTAKIPVAGNAVSLFTGAITRAIDGLNVTAERFRPFSPELSMVDAQINMERTMRDIMNAQRIGPDLAGFTRRQEDVRQRAEDLLVQLLPRLIPIAERGLDYAETIVAILEGFSDFVQQIIDKMNEVQVNILGEDLGAGNAAITGLVGGPVTMILELLTRIRQNGESRPNSGFGQNIDELYRQLFPNDQLPDPGPVVGVQNDPPNIPGAQGQLPPRLPNPIP